LSQPEPDNGYTTEKRIVELGKSKQELIEVLTGLSPGDLIVDEGVSTLVEDQKVKRILE
jgi:multidrug efflux pump subunit AcrA (membrane-fusion protein)